MCSCAKSYVLGAFTTTSVRCGPTLEHSWPVTSARIGRQPSSESVQLKTAHVTHAGPQYSRPQIKRRIPEANAQHAEHAKDAEHRSWRSGTCGALLGWWHLRSVPNSALCQVAPTMARTHRAPHRQGRPTDMPDTAAAATWPLSQRSRPCGAAAEVLQGPDYHAVVGCQKHAGGDGEWPGSVAPGCMAGHVARGDACNRLSATTTRWPTSCNDAPEPPLNPPSADHGLLPATTPPLRRHAVHPCRVLLLYVSDPPRESLCGGDGGCEGM